MCLASQKPELPEEREINKIALEIPPALPNLMSNSTYNPSSNTANLDLHALLLALTNQANNLPKKEIGGSKNLTPLVGVTLINLEHLSSSIRYTSVPIKESLGKTQKKFSLQYLTSRG